VSGLALIPAILFLLSFVVGMLNVFGGAPVYGSQRSVMSLLLCSLFLLIAFLIWPWKYGNKESFEDEFKNLPDSQSRADFIVSIAASRLGISNDKFDLLLTTDLNFSPIEVMKLWEDLAEDFCIDLCADDFPKINSIAELRRSLNGMPHLTHEFDKQNKA
jgi:hypothetical protein